MDTDAHQAFADEICAGGVPDLVIAATGVLIPQEQAERDVRLAATMIETNFTGHVTALLAFGEAMRRRGSGTIVVLSSVAAVRPRKFNSVYGATKAGARRVRPRLRRLAARHRRPGAAGPAGVRDRPDDRGDEARLRWRPRPAAVGAAVARVRCAGGKSVVWVPAPLVGLAR